MMCLAWSWNIFERINLIILFHYCASIFYLKFHQFVYEIQSEKLCARVRLMMMEEMKVKNLQKIIKIFFFLKRILMRFFLRMWISKHIMWRSLLMPLNLYYVKLQQMPWINQKSSFFVKKNPVDEKCADHIALHENMRESWNKTEIEPT